MRSAGAGVSNPPTIVPAYREYVDGVVNYWHWDSYVLVARYCAAVDGGVD